LRITDNVKIVASVGIVQFKTLVI